MQLSTTSRLARRLGSVLEPVVGQVYFSPECHQNDVALGFDPSSGDANGVALPDDDLEAVWQLGDLLREYRGDSHNAAWVAAGLTATDIGLLTELSWGMPIRSYSLTRGWTTDELDPCRARVPRLRTA